MKPVQGMVQGDKKAIATQSPDGGGCPLRQARCAARGWPPAQAPPQRESLWLGEGWQGF
ncbi:MAG: hypothetical protein MUO28_06480 [Desulfobacterales bacterium]|nr:hypothetical protein [Desulfobacterales bacterium]